MSDGFDLADSSFCFSRALVIGNAEGFEIASAAERNAMAVSVTLGVIRYGITLHFKSTHVNDQTRWDPWID
jgi:hypothetical protein